MSKLKMKDCCTKEVYERSFPEHEEFDPENACYSHKCRRCGLEFIAHKHYYQGICKKCVEKEINNGG